MTAQLERFIVYATPDESATILIPSSLPIYWHTETIPGRHNPTGLPLFLERGVLLAPDEAPVIALGELEPRVALAIHAELAGAPLEARPTLFRLAARLAETVAPGNEDLFLAACRAGIVEDGEHV